MSAAAETGPPAGPAEQPERPSPLDHPAGRQGAVGLSVALVLVGLCAYLPIEHHRSFFDEMKREGPSAALPMLIAALPLALGAATLLTRARAREPGKALTIVVAVVTVLQAIALGVLGALAFHESRREREYALAFSLLVSATGAVAAVARGRKLTPWPRLAHMLAGLAVEYLPIAVAMMYELGRKRSGPLGVDLFLVAAGVILPFVFWVVWPPRWRAAPAAKR